MFRSMFGRCLSLNKRTDHHRTQASHRHDNVCRLVPRTRQHTTVCAALLAAAVLATAAACGGDSDEAAQEPSEQTEMSSDASAMSDEMVKKHPVASATHVTGKGTYSVHPTVGGDHFPLWQNCDFYTSPVMDETAAHSLEHGAVWVAYQSGIDQATMDAIKARVTAETHLLASPYPDLKTPIVLSAWEHQLAVSSWDDPAVDTFLSTYLGRRSPSAPKAGDQCTDAIGKAGDPNYNYDKTLELATQEMAANESITEAELEKKLLDNIAMNK